MCVTYSLLYAYPSHTLSHCQHLYSEIFPCLLFSFQGIIKQNSFYLLILPDSFSAVISGITLLVSEATSDAPGVSAADMEGPGEWDLESWAAWRAQEGVAPKDGEGSEGAERTVAPCCEQPRLPPLWQCPHISQSTVKNSRHVIFHQEQCLGCPEDGCPPWPGPRRESSPVPPRHPSSA